MAYSKIDRLIEQLGEQAQDNPKIQALIAAVEKDPKKWADAAERIFRSLLYRAGGDPADFGSFPIVADLPPGTIPLGLVDNGRGNGPTFSLPEPDPSNLQHIGIFGQTRYGKSYMIMHICRERMLRGSPVWMFDMEDEFTPLIQTVPEPSKPIAITPAHLLINFFQPPGDWIEIRSWVGIIGLLLRGGMFLRDGSENLFTDSLLRLLKSKGVFAGNTEFPSLAETLCYFQSLKLSGSEVRGKTWLETLINRLRMLTNNFSQTARVTNSNLLQLLAQRSVIFRLRGQSGVPLQFLVNFLLVWLSYYKEGIQNESPYSSY